MPWNVRTAVRDLFAADGAGTLDQRLFRLICLTSGVLLLLVVTPTNIIEGLPWILTGTVAAFGLASLVLYRRTATKAPAILAFLSMFAVVLNVAWFTDGGSTGSIAYFFGVAVVCTTIFLRGRARWATLSFFVVNGAALLLLDLRFPTLPVAFATESDRTLDLVTGLVVSAIASAAIIWLLRAAYDGERQRQSVLNEQLSAALETNRRRAAELEASLAEVKTLRGLLPICSNCKSVRDDAGLWTQIERYVSAHTDASVTHALCPTCLHSLFPDDAKAVLEQIERAKR